MAEICKIQMNNLVMSKKSSIFAQFFARSTLSRARE